MIGALLLIIVVIAAVGSIAFFLSTAAKNAENRSSLLTSVQDENLQIVYAQFSPSNPNVQWELNSTTTPSTPPDYYVQFVNSSEVTLTPFAGTTGPILTAVLSGGNTLAISAGEDVSLSPPPPPPATCKTCQTITFPGSGYAFYPVDTWSSAIISVRNLNTEQSSLYQIQANSNWLASWEQVTQSGQPLTPAVTGAPNSPAIIIPAGATFNFKIDLVPYNIAKDDSVKITLLTTAGNYFSTNYSPPSALVRSSTSSENYLVTTRDIVTLDGSESLSSNSIQSYLWQIELPMIAAGCTTAAFSNPSNLDVAYATGETIQYLPESLFSSAQLASDCITGPMEATLTVVDNNGFISTSQPLLIAPDSNIAPVTSISASPTSCTTGNSCPVTIQVDDIFGNPVSGAVVTAITTAGDAQVTSPGPAGTTGSNGQVTFSVSWINGGSVQFDTGALPPVSVSFS